MSTSGFVENPWPAIYFLRDSRWGAHAIMTTRNVNGKEAVANRELRQGSQDAHSRWCPLQRDVWIREYSKPSAPVSRLHTKLSD
jgi:hypothetical protein